MAVSPILGSIGQGLSLIGALKGLFGGAGPDPRQQYLNQYAANLAQQQNNLLNADTQGMYSLAGQGGDAIAQLGRRLGSAMAGAGVYDSSATAGALTQAQANAAQQIASLASANKQSELENWLSGQNSLLNARLGVAGENVAYGRQQYQNALMGLQSMLGSLAGGGRAAPGGNAGRTRGPASIIGNQNGTPTTVPAVTPLFGTPAGFNMGGYQRPNWGRLSLG